MAEMMMHDERDLKLKKQGSSIPHQESPLGSTPSISWSLVHSIGPCQSELIYPFSVSAAIEKRNELKTNCCSEGSYQHGQKKDISSKCQWFGISWKQITATLAEKAMPSPFWNLYEIWAQIRLNSYGGRVPSSHSADCWTTFEARV